MNNSQVAQAFWDNKPKPCKSKSLFYEDGKLFSYGTIILQRIGENIIGNGTKYSQTTSCHQTTASIYKANIVLYEVPRGCHDLLEPAQELYYELEYILNS